MQAIKTMLSESFLSDIAWVREQDLKEGPNDHDYEEEVQEGQNHREE